MMIRQPGVAGSFYPGREKPLREMLDSMLADRVEPRPCPGLIVPHAGYVYSGKCAASGFKAVEITETVILIGISHRGRGAALAVDAHEYWSTPLGETAVDLELARRLTATSALFKLDKQASLLEHSLEVQLPFLQYLRPDVKILPITVSSVEAELLLAAGIELGRLLLEERKMLLVASTDFSHYLPATQAAELDRLALEKIEELDPMGLFTVVRDNRISMCGMPAAVLTLQSLKSTGARSAEIIQYTNSGEVSGDFAEVVAYASILVY